MEELSRKGAKAQSATAFLRAFFAPLRLCARKLQAALNSERIFEGLPMYFKQFYLACLAHASYLIGSDGEAVVVDPQRGVDEYLAEASAHGLQIKYVIETHLHADFISGHMEIAARTSAQIIFGEKAEVAFAHRAGRDGEEIT